MIWPGSCVFCTSQTFMKRIVIKSFRSSICLKPLHLLMLLYWFQFSVHPGHVLLQDRAIARAQDQDVLGELHIKQSVMVWDVSVAAVSVFSAAVLGVLLKPPQHTQTEHYQKDTPPTSNISHLWKSELSWVFGIVTFWSYHNNYTMKLVLWYYCYHYYHICALMGILLNALAVQVIILSGIHWGVACSL